MSELRQPDTTATAAAAVLGTYNKYRQPHCVWICVGNPRVGAADFDAGGYAQELGKQNDIGNTPGAPERQQNDAGLQHVGPA